MKNKFRQHIEKTTSLTDEEFDFVFSHFKRKQIDKKQCIIKKGKPVENVYWVLKGLMKASYLDLNGKQHIIQFAVEDWWITDYQAFINKKKATIDVSCLETSEVLVLSFSDREKMCSENQKMANFFRIKSNASNAALQKRVLTLLSSNSEERYNELLSEHPKLLQRVPKHLIASYLGLSRETLSRLSVKKRIDVKI